MIAVKPTVKRHHKAIHGALVHATLILLAVDAVNTLAGRPLLPEHTCHLCAAGGGIFGALLPYVDGLGGS